jgi:hypothetical protein
LRLQKMNDTKSAPTEPDVNIVNKNIENKIGINYWRWPSRLTTVPHIQIPRVMSLSTALCVMLMTIWVVMIAGPYLDFDPSVVPTGREYLSSVDSHHIWVRVQQCGLCALWNGNRMGGAPYLADIYGSLLHPLVIISTLLFGVINGSKATLIATFCVAGLAQWWLGTVLGLGLFARVWTTALAISGGHLTGRMEDGAFGMVLSTASGALIFPSVIMTAFMPNGRNIVTLASVIFLLILSGQGYIQIATLAIFPLSIFLVERTRTQVTRYGRALLTAGIIGILLASPLVIPALHFFPNFIKDIDPALKSAQPFWYGLLNFVIDSPQFYRSDALQKLPFPFLYTNYIGWAAVVFAAIGVQQKRHTKAFRVTIFLSASMLTTMWMASGDLFKILQTFDSFPWLVEKAQSVRYPALMGGLSIPPLLALSGLGIDAVWNFGWPQVRISFGSAEGSPSTHLTTRWLLIPVLIVSLNGTYQFSRAWVGTARLEPYVDQLLDALKLPDLQWVNPPFGEHFFIERATSRDMKMYVGIRRWYWRGRTAPEPVLEANRSGAPQGMTLSQTVAGIGIYAAPGREYASVTSELGNRSVCKATGSGGDIDVSCTSPQGGILTVTENSWSGWGATVDGSKVELTPSRWLSVRVPAGTVQISFRYRPWDVPVGIAFMFIGMLASWWVWHSPGEEIGGGFAVIPRPPVPIREHH